MTEEELTLEKEDMLTLYEQDDQDWLLVGNGSQVGFVPRNYVEVTKRHSARLWVMYSRVVRIVLL
jgi:hypothetical protein